MHEVRTSECIFGCSLHADCFAHYLCCPVLAVAVSVALGDPLPIPPPEPSFLLPPLLDSRKDILRIFISFHTYHSLKKNVLNNCRQRYLCAARTAIAARHNASNLWRTSRPLFVTVDAARPAAASVSNTRFAQGGDHFMTTSFT